MPKVLRNKPCILLWLNFTQRRQQANSRALILNIQGAIDHSCLKNCSEREYKTVTSCYCNFLILNRIILSVDYYQSNHPPVILTTRMHMYSLYCEFFVIGIHHGGFPYFSFHFVDSKKQQKLAFTPQYTVFVSEYCAYI